MDYKIILNPRAEQEIEDAMDWYKSKILGLEVRFLSILKLHFQHIKKNPFSFPIKDYKLRECMVNVFPFIILYRIDENKIIIHSVFNTNLNPTKKP